MDEADGEPLIQVSDLNKTFRVLKKNPGVWGAVKALFSPYYNHIEAVKDVSFDIQRGELVGYVGPNGAGKSTTIKMMSGILYPTHGHIKVNGLDPFKHKKKYAMKLGVMFGQRTQLWWDLPVSESFDLLRAIYKVEKSEYTKNLEYFNETLGIFDFWSQPVRRLSLGQRVRADLAASLIHNPSVLFLDEPTIGLDILAREKFRTLIKKINRERKTTILITSHDLGDIENIANRLILIDKGSVLYDGALKSFIKKHSFHTRMIITFGDKITEQPLPPGVSIVEKRGSVYEFELNRHEVNYEKMLAALGSWGELKDMVMESGSLGEVLTRIYKDVR